MSENKWVVVNIGCIECGVSSNIVGVFNTQEDANRTAEEFENKFRWREGGQNSFEIFQLGDVGVIHEEYLTNE